MFANLVEVFSSVQGEGLYLGCRQLFVRFLGCNLTCAYCDTPASLTQTRQCRIEQDPGNRNFINRDNPLSLEQTYTIISNFDLNKHHSISFTGGEPLLQSKFLLKLIPLFKTYKPLIFLETNGTLPERLSEVINLIDIISMDIKLNTSIDWSQQESFLRIATQKSPYVKVVILSDTTDQELLKCTELIASINRAIPLVLQPVTPYGSVRSTPSPERLLYLQSFCLNRLSDVRVIPQTHKILGQL